MRLVMGGESLEGPLTGIGQYTYHLAKGILASPDIEDLKFQVHGKLREPESLMAACGNSVSGVRPPSAKLSIPNQLLGKARSIAGRSNLAVELYRRLMPRLERYTLRHYLKSDIYHSPNYILPEFPGKTVVSILDLSTYRYPEHHPQARVQFVNGHIERAVKTADHIITISEFVKAEIIERFQVPESRITVTYLGADSRFRPMSEPEFNEQASGLGLGYKDYFLFTSSIEPRKNLDRLLDAYLAYRAESTEHPLPLIITGNPGWKSQHTHERLQLLQSKGFVKYLGHVEQQILPVLVAGARAVLYPSLYEGFGLPIIEAMQSGTATMTSRGTSMEEISGDASLLVNAIDVAEMADAITSLANQPESTALLGSRGLDNAKAFSWANCANQTIEAYAAA